MPACDLLLTNATVLTMDARFTVYSPGSVAITGDSLIALGPEAQDYHAADTIDCHGRVVMPGLVNAHTHVPMALLRGLADDLRLDVWLMGYMMPVEREFVSPEFVRLGTRLGCAEMIRSGDHLLRRHVLLRGSGRRGDGRRRHARAVRADRAALSHARRGKLRGLAGSRPRLHRALEGHPLIVPAPAPHAPYTCTPEILRACAELAVEFDVPLHIHLSETLLEVEDSRQQHGMPVVPWVKKQGLFDAKVLAAHCVHVDEGEMRHAQERRRRRRAQPDEQPEAGRRHRAGRPDAGARRERRHRHRRSGVEQRPRHVRGDAAGRAAGQGHRPAIRPRFPRATALAMATRLGAARCTWIT